MVSQNQKKWWHLTMFLSPIQHVQGFSPSISMSPAADCWFAGCLFLPKKGIVDIYIYIYIYIKSLRKYLDPIGLDLPNQATATSSSGTSSSGGSMDSSEATSDGSASETSTSEATSESMGEGEAAGGGCGGARWNLHKVGWLDQWCPLRLGEGWGWRVEARCHYINHVYKHVSVYIYK